MDILLGKYEIQTFKYIGEHEEANSACKPNSGYETNPIISHLLGGGLTLMFYLIFWTLASNLKY